MRRHISTMLRPKALNIPTIHTLTCNTHIQIIQRHRHFFIAIFRHQCHMRCLIQLLKRNKHHLRVQIKSIIDQVHFFTQNFVFYRPMSIILKCNEKHNKVKLRKIICGKNLNVLTKSLSVKTRNLTKSHVTQGGFLLKCVRFSQSLDDDVQFHSLTCLSLQQSNNM
jgi:hypothetical protein